MLKGKPLRNCYFDDFKEPCNYPQRTVAGMYKQEQELAKADEAGLILTAVDLQNAHPICENCGEPVDDEFATCLPCNRRYLCR
ncbi:MAG: hypothetical protein [Bacteriophage sp.]|nr:MAG: hypothetical protein [Bacteriophage sp.]